MCKNSGIIVLACKPETTRYTHTVCFVLVTNAKNSVSAVARKHKYFFPLHAWVADVVV